jgi:hypothetical protein
VATLDNPAARLRRALLAFKKGATNPQSTQMGAAIAVALGVKFEEDEALFFRRLTQFMELPGEVRGAVGELDNVDPDVLLKRLPEVENKLSMFYSLKSPCAGFMGAVSDTVLDSLEVCSSMLHLHRPEPVPTKEQLDEIRESLSTLLDDVQAADKLSFEIRSFLASHLHDMLWAVDEFAIGGTKPLERAVQWTIGDLTVHRELAKATEKEKLGKRFFETMSKVLIVLSVLHTGYQLTEAAVPALQPTHDPEVIVIDSNPPAVPPATPPVTKP